jgi:hypothetical protein
MNWVQGWGAWGGEEVESPKGPSGSLTIRSLRTGKVNGPTHICPTVSRSPAVAQITSLCFRFRQVSRSLSRVRLAFSSRTARVKLTHVRFTLRSLGTGKVNGPTHICPTVSRSPAVAQITSPCVRFRQGSRSLARPRSARVQLTFGSCFRSRSARSCGQRLRRGEHRTERIIQDRNMQAAGAGFMWVCCTGIRRGGCETSLESDALYPLTLPRSYAVACLC